VQDAFFDIRNMIARSSLANETHLLLCTAQPLAQLPFPRRERAFVLPTASTATIKIIARCRDRGTTDCESSRPAARPADHDYQLSRTT